jgi:hypothetical protein
LCHTRRAEESGFTRNARSAVAKEELPQTEAPLQKNPLTGGPIERSKKMIQADESLKYLDAAKR